MVQIQSFGEILRSIRERMGKSQWEFSRIIQVPIGTLRDWEQGRKAPSADRAKAIGDRLGVDVEVLLGSKPLDESVSTAEISDLIVRTKNVSKEYMEMLSLKAKMGSKSAEDTMTKVMNILSAAVRELSEPNEGRGTGDAGTKPHPRPRRT